MRVPPYGAQRELLLLSDADAAGLPRHNPMPRAWSLWRIRGELDTHRLATAARAVAAGNDVWRGRFSAGPDGPELVRGAEPPEFPVSIVECSRERAGEVLGAVVYAPIDLARAPLAGACLVRLAADDHALALVVDHGFADHFTLTRFVRAVAAAYQDPLRTPPPVPSFFAHAAAAARDPLRQSSRRFWADAMSRPVPPLSFPGGHWKPWRQTTATGAYPVPLGPAQLAAIRTGLDRTGAGAGGLMLAALSFVIRLWTEADVPVLYARAGRGTRESLAVPGALHEAVVSVPPAGPAPRTLPGWVRDIASANAATPPLLGQWLTDFGGVEALRARRLLVLNVVAREPTYSLGTARIGPADEALRASVRPPAGHRGFPAHNALHLSVHWSARAPELTVYHDPEVLPDPEPVAGSLIRFFELLAAEPDIDPGRAADTLRADWPLAPA